MTTVPYNPRPGSAAYRALAHLETLPHGEEISTAKLAEAIDVPVSNFMPCMLPAVEARVVFRRQKDHSHPRSPFFWSLVDHTTNSAPAGASPAGDGSQKPDGEAPSSSTAPARAGRLTPLRASQQVLKAEAPRPDATDREQPVIPSPVGGPMGAGQPAAAGPFRCALWSTGELVLCIGDDEPLVLDREKTTHLIHYLDRMAVETTPETAA